jgi:AcrR family transcriptional regulator
VTEPTDEGGSVTESVDEGVMTDPGKPMRADARRNRARVLDAAIKAFAADGLSVPVHEIARRAGVGTGTVSRHFPTKEALFQAIVSSRVEHLVARAQQLSGSLEPGPAFFAFLAVMVSEGAADRGLADALAGSGFDIEGAAARTGKDVGAALGELLAGAQHAEAVRADVTAADVKALIAGCLAGIHDPADADVPRRLLDVVCAGLRR